VRKSDNGTVKNNVENMQF